jgi:hypothetical protein
VGRYDVITRRLPLLVVKFDGVVGDDDFDTYLVEMKAVLARKQLYVVVFDARNAGRPTATQRERQGAFLQEHRAGLSTYCLGGAFVISSALIRAALQGILWMGDLPYDHVVVETFPEAERWSKARLAARELSAPD